MVAEGDQSWVKNVSDFRNVKEMIQAYYNEVSQTDFVPKDDEERALFDLFFGWLEEKRPSLSSPPGRSSLAKAKPDRTIRIVSED